jgi:DNA (cytosine-5)-methyltransferase 1
MKKVGSDFSGVGAFDQALKRLGIEHENIFACDMDKYARQTYILNHGEPGYFPTDVYEREIPTESLDIYMTSPPCQAFSLAGKRLGEKDKRGILFYNSHEFIKVNKPRFFIFENVKGLLSDNSGKTFGTWIELLGGKSVNGNTVMFPHDEAVPYHIYWKVLNAKNYNIPQNRERVFIVGIRDDEDNYFNWPQEVPLTKRLKDVLEDEVDEKYFLSDKMLECISFNGKEKGIIADLNKGGQKGEVNSENSNYISCLTATDYKQPKQIQIGTWRTHEDGKGFREMQDELCPTIPARAREDGSGQPVLKIQSNTFKGYEVATENDSINFSVPSSKTRRGRVGKGVSQTLDTACYQGVISDQRIRRLTPLECFRLMDFNKDFKCDVSDTQAYKQAGNSICVGVLAGIISKLKL